MKKFLSICLLLFAFVLSTVASRLFPIIEPPPKLQLTFSTPTTSDNNEFVQPVAALQDSFLQAVFALIEPPPEVISSKADTYTSYEKRYVQSLPATTKQLNICTNHIRDANFLKALYSIK